MILLKIRGSCISRTSIKKKEKTRLEEELMSRVRPFEDYLCESNVHLLEGKKEEEKGKQELIALRN